MASRLRPTYQIDGSDTVELDYSCMFLSMLYHLSGKTLPSKGDLYHVVGYSSDCRVAIKLITNIILNFNSKRGLKAALLAKMDLYDRELKDGKVVGVDRFQGIPVPGEVDREALIIDVVHSLERSPIGNFIFRKNREGERDPIGLYLMNRESRVAAKIINSFVCRGEIVLPVHDSFVCRRDLKGELHNAMLKFYREEFGQDPLGIK